MNEITKYIEDAPELKAIEKSKADMISAVFVPMVERLKVFESSFNSIIEESKKGINENLVVKSKRLRIDISRVRIETEKARKEQKEEYLRAGKAIDGVANILKWAVTEKEEALEKIEKHFETLEKERIEKLQLEREEQFLKQQYTQIISSEAELSKRLKETYGDISIDLKTGEITYS